MSNAKSKQVYSPTGELIQRPDPEYAGGTFRYDEKDYFWFDASDEWKEATPMVDFTHKTTSKFSGAKAVLKVNGVTVGQFDDIAVGIDYIPVTVKYREKKCECGSEKAGAYGHSDWCPKHEGKNV